MLRATLETADHIGTGLSGVYGLSRVHFLLVEVSDQAFRQLCQHGVEQEDMEDSGDAELECEDEGAQCDDEGADTDREPDDRRLPRWREWQGKHPATGAPGKWVIAAKESGR